MFSVARGFRLLRNVKVPCATARGWPPRSTYPSAEGALPERAGAHRVQTAREFRETSSPATAWDWSQQDCRGPVRSTASSTPSSTRRKTGVRHAGVDRTPAVEHGAVGMFGDSYLAGTQFYAAPEGSPCLESVEPAGS